jgi:hypothetical protein
VAVAFFFRGRAATTGDEQKCDKKEAQTVGQMCNGTIDLL